MNDGADSAPITAVLLRRALFQAGMLELVIEEAAARRIAEAHLASPTLVITGCEEYPIGWAYFYNTSKYVETGNYHHALIGNAPVLVRRSDGAILPTGLALPLDFYVAQHEQRAAWESAATEFERLLTAAVEELAVVGPTMRVPVADRVRARFPEVPEPVLGEAIARCTLIGERALELTREDHDGEAVYSALTSEYPEIYPPVWSELQHRAEYWWEWEI